MSVDNSSSEKKLSKILLWLVPLVVLFAFITIFYQRLGDDTQIKNTQMLSKSVPSFSLPALENPEQQLTKADLPQKPYLLNVWGSWCPSCSVEHPFFMQLAQSGVTIVGINYSDDRELALDYLKEKGNPFVLNVFDDNGSLAVDLGLTGAPETYVVDALGNIRQHRVGVINQENWQGSHKPCMNVLTKLGTELTTNEAKQQIAKACG